MDYEEISSMRTIFIIHGSYGHPGENWFPWLKKELEKLGEHVVLSQFPVPKKENSAYGGHDLNRWLRVMDRYRNFINEKTVLVAHSRGCVFSYHFLSRLSNPIDSVFLVAPWMVYRWYPKGWNKIDSFHQKPFIWKKIKKGAKYFEVYQSSNDDTPTTEGKDIAQKLDAKLILVRNAGHFNVAYDKKYIKFPLLFENIKSRL